MTNVVFGTAPNQVPRNSDLGALAYMAPSSLVPPFIHVREEQAAGVAGGTSSSSGLHDRVLNTVVSNTITGASLASSQVTLPAGTYDFISSAPSGQSAGNRLFLFNVTDSVNILQGENSTNGSGANNSVPAICQGRFTLTSTKVVKLRHYISNGIATFGLGYSIGVTGVPEVYSSLQIWKVDL